MEKNGISRETLVALHETAGIGCKTIGEIWAARKQRPVKEGMRAADLRDCGLTPRQAAAAAASLTPERMEERRERRRRGGFEIVTLADKEYPRRLKKIEDVPPVLYYKGMLELISRPSIAVVGTRLATAYGRHVAEQFASVFAGRGLTVVSGLARGIDTCAHVGALHRAAGTIAVLGLPVDRIYPPENRRLYREIEEQGLLLSEAPPDTPYHKGMFPARNRIISGLALGVLVVEAPKESGSLITATEAMKIDRPVFVVPGPITSPRSRGALELIQEGTAEAVIAAEDIVKRFQRYLEPESVHPDPGLPVLQLTDDENFVYNLLLDEPCSIDELSAQSDIPAGVLHAVLLSLQFKKAIHQLPGSLYHVI